MENTNTHITPINLRMMEANLSIGAWGVEKIDRSTSKEVAKQKGAKDGRAKVTKKLVPDEALKPIKTCIKHIRAVHESHTIPIGKGRSVIPAVSWMDFRKVMNKMFDEYDAAVDDFVRRVYPEILSKAEADMGALYDATEFPEPHELSSRFHREVSLAPMPDNDRLLDLCDIPKEELDNIYNDAQKDAEEQVTNIRRDAYLKILDPVKHLADVCLKSERLYESSFDKVHDMLDKAECFNLAGSDEFTSMIGTLRYQLTGYTVDDCRKDKDLKKSYGRKAEECAKVVEEAMVAAGVLESDASKDADEMMDAAEMCFGPAPTH